MPDHLHLLVEAGDKTSSLVAFVKAAKQMSGYHAKAVLGGRLWQTGYFERVMRSDQDTKAMARYIIQNPCAPDWSRTRVAIRTLARHDTACVS